MIRKIFFIIIILGATSQAGLLYTYHQLTLKDLDQMSSLVKNKIKESKAAYSGKSVPLKEALQSVFSRPNSDDMISKVMDQLRYQLDQEEAYEKVFEELIQEALNALTNTKNFKKDVQVTYAIFLENFISEFKPDLTAENFEMKMIKKIADSKIELTKDARKERQLRLMSEGSSPSELAKKVIQDYEKRKEEELKNKEKLDATKDSEAAPKAEEAKESN
jgi:hypothetical protein